MRNSPFAAPARQIVYPEEHGVAPAGSCGVCEPSLGRESLPAASLRGRLIDTRLVRVELARLRGPRPATGVYRARVTRTTISG